MNKKQHEELGKMMLDLAKYLITAFLFGQFFKESWQIEWIWLLFVCILAFALIGFGLFLLRRCNDNNQPSAPAAPTITEVKKGIFHIQHAEINN